MTNPATIDYKQYFKFGRVEFPNDKSLGIGVFAIQSISKGTCILSEPPLIVATMSALEHKVSQLNDGQRRQMFALVDSHSSSSPPQKKTALGIFRSNAYPCPSHPEETNHQDFGGLFPIFARFNSSCTPNVSHRYIPSIDRRHVYASRDIAPGEELLTCYIDPPYQERDVRRQILKERFRFTCGCTACSLEGQALITSNYNRSRLNALDNDTFECIRRGRYAKAIQLVHNRLQLLKEEGLDNPPGLLRVAFDAYQACDHDDNKKGAKEWLEKVKECTILCDTPEAVEEVDQLINKL